MPDQDSEQAVITRLRAAGSVFAEDEARLLLEAADTGRDLDSLVQQRAAGVPIEHLLGWVEFAGMRLRVTPGVFVPRKRTELLADTALHPPGRPPRTSGTVVELCCGAGAVSAALAAALDPLELHAADIDPHAVRCAATNLPARAQVHEGDLAAPLPESLRGRVDVLVANAPYVPSGAVRSMPPEAREHEPLVALDGGDDGLDVQRRVVALAPRWLAPGGDLLVEVADHQAHLLCRAVAAAGLEPEIVRSAEIEATAVVGRAASS